MIFFYFDFNGTGYTWLNFLYLYREGTLVASCWSSSFWKGGKNSFPFQTDPFSEGNNINFDRIASCEYISIPLKYLALGYKTFFMLNSAEHLIFTANKRENAISYLLAEKYFMLSYV